MRQIEVHEVRQAAEGLRNRPCTPANQQLYDDEDDDDDDDDDDHDDHDDDDDDDDEDDEDDHDDHDDDDDDDDEDDDDHDDDDDDNDDYTLAKPPTDPPTASITDLPGWYDSS